MGELIGDHRPRGQAKGCHLITQRLGLGAHGFAQRVERPLGCVGCIAGLTEGRGKVVQVVRDGLNRWTEPRQRRVEFALLLPERGDLSLERLNPTLNKAWGKRIPQLVSRSAAVFNFGKLIPQAGQLFLDIAYPLDGNIPAGLLPEQILDRQGDQLREFLQQVSKPFCQVSDQWPHGQQRYLKLLLERPASNINAVVQYGRLIGHILCKNAGVPGLLAKLI